MLKRKRHKAKAQAQAQAQEVVLPPWFNYIKSFINKLDFERMESVKLNELVGTHDSPGKGRL